MSSSGMMRKPSLVKVMYVDSKVIRGPHIEPHGAQTKRNPCAKVAAR